MRFEFTEEQKEFKQRVCDFFARELTPEVVAANWDPQEHNGFKYEFTRAFRQKLGAHGFLGIGLPGEYGGGGKDMVFQVILAEEAEYHSAPGIDRTVTYLAPSILALGTEEQKRHFLPRIVRGEIGFFVGYSEPEAGSDLSNVQTRAVADGDDFVINGQKLFSSDARYAEYGWVAARTDPDVPKHRGLSLFIVDMKSPGITVTSHTTLVGWKHDAVFFENVRIPKTSLVGELNRGWYNIMAAIDYERAALGNPGQVLRSFHRLLAYCKETKRNGKPLSQDPLIRNALADLAVDVEATRLMSYWVASMHDKGLHPQHETSLSALFKRETARRIDYVGVEILGLYAQLKRGSRWAPLNGEVEWRYKDNLYFHFAAGGFDITRNVIAIRGLGLPRGG